jgi:hypothetical protein
MSLFFLSLFSLFPLSLFSLFDLDFLLLISPVMVTYFTSYPILNIVGAKKNKKKVGDPGPKAEATRKGSDR